MTAEPRALLRSLSDTLATDPATPRPASVFLGTPFSGEAGDVPAEVSAQAFGGMGAALAIGPRRPPMIMPVNDSASPALFRNRILPAGVAPLHATVEVNEPLRTDESPDRDRPVRAIVAPAGTARARGLRAGCGGPIGRVDDAPGGRYIDRTINPAVRRTVPSPMVVDPRSMLFVSGARADRFAKAFAAGADLVCIDLEDAIQPSDKAAARTRVFEWLRARPAGAGPYPAGAAVRINGLRTDHGLRDAAALADSGSRLDWLLLPKVESPVEIELIASWAGERFNGLVALIESPAGVENAPAIAASIRALGGARPGALMLGGADLTLELGAQFGWDALLFARGRLVNAARSAGLQPWDVPFLGIDDPEGLAAETRRVIALGYACKAAIHPAQVPTLHRAFAPEPEQVRWAQAVVEAQAQAATGAFLFEGKLVDAPILVRAERILALAARQSGTR